MYEWFNQGLWEKCFERIDPKLREESKVELPVYVDQLQAFQEAYGTIHPWYIRINLHLDDSSGKPGERPFAYVYVIWQDERHGFHMFRERWVRHADQWFTRVVGLVPNRQELIRSE
jgi:hypothetical protein